jgi:hypothetical protein
MAPLWGHFVFWPSVVEDEYPVRPTRPRSCQLATQRRRRKSIPPSPPENEKAPLWGLFVFRPSGLRMRTLFDGRSSEAACPVAKRLSHLLSIPRGSFLF